MQRKIEIKFTPSRYNKIMNRVNGRYNPFCFLGKIFVAIVWVFILVATILLYCLPWIIAALFVLFLYKHCM